MKDLFFIKVLRVQGIHFDKPLGKFRLAFDLLSTLFLLVMMFCNFIMEGDFESMKSIASVILAMIKYVFMVIMREDIAKLFKDIDGFWDLDVDDEQITFLKKYPTRLSWFYRCFISTGTTIFLTRAFFSKKLTIFACYIPPQIPLPIFFLAEAYLLVAVSVVYPSFNMLIGYLVSSVSVQFRLLNLKIQAMDLEGLSENKERMAERVRDLKRKIEYHQHLIGYTERVNTMFSIPMGLLVALGVSLLCLDMYILSLEISSFVNIFRAFVTIVAVTSEFLIAFGLPAQLLMDQAEDTANTIYYECKWFLPDLIPIRKYLIMMIMRSQKSVCITALNYHVINKETVVLMLKTAYSFFAFLQTVT